MKKSLLFNIATHAKNVRRRPPCMVPVPPPRVQKKVGRLGNHGQRYEIGDGVS
jgi:hypothetical protein